MTGSPPGDVVDAHVHFWDPTRLSYPWLRGVPALDRRRLPGDLTARGLTGAVVAVEAGCLPGQAVAERQWLESLATADPNGVTVRAVVAHLPIERGARITGAYRVLSARPLVVGVRRPLHDEPAAFLYQPGLLAGLRLLARHDLVFDALVRPDQLPALADLAQRAPDTRVVLDHLGNPDASALPAAQWLAATRRLAALPNVTVKLSGLLTSAAGGRWSAAGVRAHVRHAVEVFGPDRCLYGSDWPVIGTAGDPAGWRRLILAGLPDLSVREIALVLGGTAERVYGLQHRPLSTVSDPP